MDLTDAYENGAYIPDAASYPPRWEAEAAAFRARMAGRSEMDQPYGPDPRQRMDLFFPPETPLGLVVFIHGGYWLKFDKSYWSHLAAGAVKRGWALAMPSYRLAPQVRISQITRDIAEAVAVASDEVAGPIVVTGHSAGGHLAARMACAGVLPEPVVARIRRVVPISPLSDLRPLMQTDMNAELEIDPAEAEAESPMLAAMRPGIDAVVWVGADERPAFLDQARWLCDAWDRTRLHIAPSRHHFDVIDGLGDPNSALTCDLLEGVI